MPKTAVKSALDPSYGVNKDLTSAISAKDAPFLTNEKKSVSPLLVSEKKSSLFGSIEPQSALLASSNATPNSFEKSSKNFAQNPAKFSRQNPESPKPQDPTVFNFTTSKVVDKKAAEEIPHF